MHRIAPALRALIAYTIIFGLPCQMQVRVTHAQYMLWMSWWATLQLHCKACFVAVAAYCKAQYIRISTTKTKIIMAWYKKRGRRHTFTLARYTWASVHIVIRGMYLGLHFHKSGHVIQFITHVLVQGHSKMGCSSNQACTSMTLSQSSFMVPINSCSHFALAAKLGGCVAQPS